MQRSGVVVAVVATLLLVFPAMSSAQEANGFVTVSPAQKELNDRAFELTAKGEYAKAIDLLNSSLAIQEINVTYLNLGRALTWAGRCDEATVAFARVTTAPAVADPTPEQVKAALAAYLEELKAHCPGTIRLKCNGEGLLVYINGHDPIACGTAKEVMPGTYTVAGENDRGRVAVEVDVVGNSERLVELTLAEPDADGMELARPLRTWGWGLVGAGSAMLLSAAAIELFVLMPGFDDLEAAADAAEIARADALRSSLSSTQGLNLGLYIGGGTIAAAGVALLLWDALAGEADGDERATWTPWFDTDGTAGIAWTVGW